MLRWLRWRGNGKSADDEKAAVETATDDNNGKSSRRSRRTDPRRRRRNNNGGRKGGTTDAGYQPHSRSSSSSGKQAVASTAEQVLVVSKSSLVATTATTMSTAEKGVLVTSVAENEATSTTTNKENGNNKRQRPPRPRRRQQKKIISESAEEDEAPESPKRKTRAKRLGRGAKDSTTSKVAGGNHVVEKTDGTDTINNTDTNKEATKETEKLKPKRNTGARRRTARQQKRRAPTTSTTADTSSEQTRTASKRSTKTEVALQTTTGTAASPLSSETASETAAAAATVVQTAESVPPALGGTCTASNNSNNHNTAAELWGKRLNQAPTYLTNDGLSWYILKKGWMPTPSQEVFDEEWALHPTKRHELKVFGRVAEESRWSQSWGVSYAYSGAMNHARPLSESTMVPILLQKINDMLIDNDTANNPYNGCLQNWYTPDDKIGLHSDDERSLLQQWPIWSLSWGGTRRFLFRPRVTKKKKPTNNTVIEVWLEDGDLLLMGGTCQMTHKHEIPKPRKRDPPTSNRINWTIRAFR